MNVRGERVIVFGDSTSHHGPDNGCGEGGAPEIWDVDQGSNRQSGQPGDLLASLLLEQGAEAVRVDARVCRSASNFFGREASQALLNADADFRPSLVFVVLGTNDIGLDLVKDAEAMTAIKAAYEGMGAVVWAIGPFTYNDQHLNAGAQAVVDMMTGVFGKRFIDGRSLSVQEGRAGDGVHFGAASAAATAANMLAAIQSASGGIPWGWIALGAVAAISGMAFFTWRHKTAKALAGASFCDPNLSPAAFKRCVGRSKRSALGARYSGDVSMSKKDAIKEYRRLLTDPDPAALEIAQDIVLQHGLKLSELSLAFSTLDQRAGSFKLDREPSESTTSIHWKVDPDPKIRNHLGPCNIELKPIVGGETLTWENEPWSHDARNTIADSSQRLMNLRGTPETCAKAATAEAWAIAKAVKKQLATEPDRWWQFPAKKQNVHRDLRRAVERALAQDNSEPKELYGLDARYQGDVSRMSKAEAEAEFQARLLDDEPGSIDVAQDIALQHDIKLSEWSMRNNRGTEAKNHGQFSVEPGYRKAEVIWKITRFNDDGVRIVGGDYPKKVNSCHANFTGYIDGQSVKWADDWPQEAQEGVDRAYGYKGTEDQCRRFAAQEAWAITKELKKSLAAERDEDFATDPVAARQARAVQAFHRAFARRGVEKEPQELFGLGARYQGDTNRMTQVEAGNEFDRLLKEPNPADMDVAQDLALQYGIKLSDWRSYRAPRGRFELTPSNDLDTSTAWYVPKKLTDVGIEVKRRRGRWQPVTPSGEIVRSATINTDGKGYDLRQNAEDAVTAFRVMSVDEKATRTAELTAVFRRTRYDTRIPNQVMHGVTLTESSMPSLQRAYVNTTWAEARKRAAADAWVIAKAIKKLPDDADEAQVKRAILDALPEVEDEPAELFGLDAARRRPQSETKTTDDGPGMSPPSQGKLQIGRKSDSYKDLPWAKVVAEAKKEAKAPGENWNKLRLTLDVQHAPNGHSQFAYVNWDPMDTKGAIKFAQKLVDDKAAMYSSVVGHAERPHDRSDRNPPKGHWTIASFEDDSVPD